jgi:hypothetical protein
MIRNSTFEFAMAHLAIAYGRCRSRRSPEYEGGIETVLASDRDDLSGGSRRTTAQFASDLGLKTSSAN